MLYTVFFLIQPTFRNAIENILNSSSINVEQTFFLYTMKDFESHSIPQNSILFSYGTSLIVPEELLNKFKYKLNLHAASPEYPGRDPHHFAHYDKVSQYGATLHSMTQKVDAGSIHDIELFDVDTNTTSPHELLAKSNNAALILLKRFLNVHLSNIEHFTTKQSLNTWGKRKTSRKDFIKACSIPVDISQDEFKKKLASFQSKSEHQNLYIDLYGHRFRYEKN